MELMNEFTDISSKTNLHDVVAGWYVGKFVNKTLKEKNKPTEELEQLFKKLQDSKQTTLSTTVQNFLIFDHNEDDKEYNLFLTNDQIPLLNFESLTFEKLTEGLSEEDLKDETKVFIKAGDFMKRVVNITHNYFVNTVKDEKDIAIYSDYFELFDEKKEEIFKATLKYHIIEKKSLFAFQFIVPFIERNLQNILFGVRIHKLKTKNKKVDLVKIEEEIPTKLSELLSDPEMIDLFGKDIIFLFKLLIGPLHGINLRNVSLHGFMTTHEWYNGFTSLILMLVFSISPICQNLRKNFEINFQQRPFEKCIHQYKKPMLSFNNFNVKEIEEHLNGSLFIIPTVKDQWKESIISFQSGEYYHCLVYLFPLIEHAIRRIYVCTNDCAERLLTAEQHSLYTTMDILLTEYQTFSENKQEPNLIFDEIGINFQNVCWDIFLWEECPRIRDMISHGGIDPFDNDSMKEIANYVLSFSLAFMVKYDVENTDNDDWINGLPLILKESYQYFENDYIPIYHPKHVVESSLKNSKDLLSKFEIKVEFPEILESKYTTKIMEELQSDIDLTLKYLDIYKIDIGKKAIRSNDFYSTKKQCLIYGVIMNEKEYKKAIKLGEILKSCDANLKLIQEHHESLWNIIIDKKSTSQNRKHFGQLISFMNLYWKFVKFSVEIVEAEFNHQGNHDQEFLTKIYNQVTAMEACLKTRRFRQVLEIFASFLIPSNEVSLIKFQVLHKKFVERNYGEVENYEHLQK